MNSLTMRLNFSGFSTPGHNSFVILGLRQRVDGEPWTCWCGRIAATPSRLATRLAESCGPS
jgi:hypothetical protein